MRAAAPAAPAAFEPEEPIVGMWGISRLVGGLSVVEMR